MPKVPPIFNEQGFSLVEALLAVALFSLGVTSFVGAIIYGQQSTAIGGAKARATYIAEEGLEAVRNIRDADYTNLVDGTYGVSTSGNSWSLSGSSDAKDIFTRQVQIATVDANRKRITSTVTWQQTPQRTGTVSLDTYLTYWQKAVAGWNSMSTTSTFDLTVANSANATADPISIAYANNFVYLGRTNSSGKEFLIFNVSNPASPTLVGSRDLNGNPNDILIRGNYAYIASTDNNSELQILDISDPTTIANAGKLTTVDLTNANSNNNGADAIALSVVGNYLLMARNGGDQLLIFDLTNPTAPGNPVGRSSAVTGVITDVVAYNTNYAYVTSTDDTNEIQVFNITSKILPVLAGTVNMNSGNNTADPLSVAIAGSNFLVGRTSSAAPELYSYSLATPTAPTLSYSLEIGASVLNMSYDSTLNYIFMATSDTTNDLKVVDNANPTAILGQLNSADSPTDLVYDSTQNKVFISDSNDTNELVIAQPN